MTNPLGRGMRIGAMLVLIACLSTGALAHPLYSLGPMSRLSQFSEGMVGNEFFGLQVERGFKLGFPAHKSGMEYWYAPLEYAGFVTLQTPDGPLFERFPQQEDGTRTLACDGWHVSVAKEADGWQQIVELATGYPFVWFSARTPGDVQGTVAWRIMGFSWADKQAPDQCEFLRPGASRPETIALPRDEAKTILTAADIGGPLVVLRNTDEKYVLALVLAAPPSGIATVSDGVQISLPSGATWACGVFPADTSWDELSRLIPLAMSRPTEQQQEFGLADGKPFVRFSSRCEGIENSWGIATTEVTPLPVSVADRAPDGALTLPTMLGDVALCPGDSVTIPLDPVADLDQSGPPPGTMKDAWRQRVNEYAAQVVARLRWSGGFTPSQGRPFYDGLTLSGLLTARPYLEPELRDRVDAAVRRTLDLWWQHMCLDGETGIWYFPEPVPFRPVVDYPEISGTILWPTVQYCAQVDPDYAAGIAPMIRDIAGTLPKAFHWSGAAFAHPGPEYTHIITESVIGGFVACCAINRLAAMIGDTELSEEYAARAALARESMKLLRWREEFGESGTISEIRPSWSGWVKAGIQVPWDYTMYTWFSYVPAFKLPAEDIYRAWASLEADEWWTYSERSNQRCYDFAHLMAVARYRGLDEALEKLAVFEDTPFGYEHFDWTPVYALMAYPWLVGLGG